MKKIRNNRRLLLMSTVACMGMICAARPAHAFDYQFDNGVDVRFDNTIQYSVAERTSPTSSYYTSNPNTNDGDENLRSGIVSNRIDLLSTFAISDQGFGFDASINSFYDTVYNQKTQNTNGATYNAASQPADKFTTATETQAGRNIEPRNLFVYGSSTIDGQPFTLRVGRLVNLFGESLFFAGNGIAYAQGPIDAERAATVPNTQAKDIFLPVGQVLLTGNLTNSISYSLYYQFEWQKFQDTPAGDFFSPTDVLDEGGQRLYAAAIAPYINAANPGIAAYLYRGRDISGSNTGQFGAALHYDPPGSSWDFGAYALQYNDSEPQIYVNIGKTPSIVKGTAPGSPTAVSAGTYQLVYANGIQIYGASASTTIGPVNLAGEASVRANEDLVSTVETAPGQSAGNNEGNALYAIGDVAHYQVNGIYLGPKILGLWDASSLAGEVAGENLFAIVKNKQNFETASARNMALGLRVVGSATYYEVLPGLDLGPSIGLGWNFMGRSPDTLAFNETGIDRGGDLTFGISGTYLNVWTGGISYTTYIAPPERAATADRQFVSFNVERTF
jgi:hypothetical protein